MKIGKNKIIKICNKEVSNYQQFRLELIKYLDYNPVIKYTDFKLKGNKLYYKNNCNFEKKDNTFKNIYYNWKKNSNVHNKFSVFNKNNLTKNKKFLIEIIAILYYIIKRGKNKLTMNI